MAIDWKTILSEFDGKPTLLQAIGKLRKAVEDETITIQQAQAEIAKLESQLKADEALITTTQTNAKDALDLATSLKGEIIDKVDKIDGKSEYIRIYGVSKDGIQTTYEASETNVPWKIVRRDASGSFDIPDATKSTQPIRKATFDFELSQKQKLLSGEKKFLFNGKEVFAPDYTGGTMVVSKGVKTIFGNQSIVGTGNIDLYRHKIAYKNINGDIFGYSTFYSSSNLQCDSLTDLKTLLGNDFNMSVYPTSGYLVNARIPLSIDNAHMLFLDTSKISTEDCIVVSGYDRFTIADTVTTI